MTREEAKELLPIIQAYADGKQIQYFEERTMRWEDITAPSWIRGIPYRVKPEPKYRPFKNAEECWKEMLKHQPLGWTKDRDNNKTFVGSVNTDNTISMGSSEVLFLEDTFKDFTFDDGTPFGIREC